MCVTARQPAKSNNALETHIQAHIAGRAMTREDDLRVRIGRIRSRGEQRGRPFIAQALAAAEKAGGLARGSRSRTRSSTFGRGRVASLAAARLLNDRSRGVVVKARVVRHGIKRAPLGAHLTYLRREGVTKDGAKGRMFDAQHDESDHRAFAERCDEDRHHFRFIVSPDDAAELSDLRRFTRDLMAQAEQDLGTKLDWVGVDHWNTEHPHIHIIVRGRTDKDQDLVISRDYIREGMRAQTQRIVTLELGPRSDQEIKRSMESQVEAERWTRLDRTLMREATANNGIIDLRPDRNHHDWHAVKIGRMRKLERLGLAHPVEGGRWTFVDNAELTLRQLGERNDIIKRIHRSLAQHGWDRPTSGFELSGEGTSSSVAGRLAARGLDDELKATAYVVIDGIDGRAHHVQLADLDAAGDSEPGSIVELRRYEDAKGRQRMAIAVRSDLSIEMQVEATGATWLDRQLLSGDVKSLSEGGFGSDVHEAMKRRADYLVGEGFARRQGQRIVFVRDLLNTLRQRELDEAGNKLSVETGLPYHGTTVGESVAGVYRQRVCLASGRFAMIDNGLGFNLVPWTPSIERQHGRQVSGLVRPGGSIEWISSRRRGIEL
jgi:type IV secretory pathway VirD2 relaxase